MFKYGTDEYGNVWRDFAQKEPVGGTYCLNPEKETLTEPPEVSETQRLSIENGSWLVLSLGSKLVREGSKIRPKTQLELMRDGIEDVPKGQKISEDEDCLKLINKTLEERLKTGDIIQSEYDKIRLDDCHTLRKQAYAEESDGLFFDYQRGEIDKEVWLNKVIEIKERFPKP